MNIINAFKSQLIGIVRVLACAALVLVSASIFQLPASAATINIDANSTSFDPPQVKVQPGDILHFEMQASPPHNVIFGAKGESNLAEISHSEMVMTGGFDITIPEDTKPGTYQYWCTPHRSAGMVGEIVVKG